MARRARIEYEGAYCHVMSRGDRREVIFEDAEDRMMFMQTLAECCERSGWRVYAWMLTSNYYLWVIRIPVGNLVEEMRCVAEHLGLHTATNVSQQVQREEGVEGIESAVGEKWIVFVKIC